MQKQSLSLSDNERSMDGSFEEDKKEQEMCMDEF